MDYTSKLNANQIVPLEAFPYDLYNNSYLMKIMHIVQCAGGVDRYLSMLLPLLEKNGIHQTLVCSCDYDRKEYESIVDDVEQINLQQSFNPVVIIHSILSIRVLIKKYNPEIIYCHSSMAGGLGRIACIGLPVKVVYNPHGWAFNMQ